MRRTWWNAEKMLNIRVSDDEDRMLKALAVEHQGMSISDVVRQYIRRAFARPFPPATKKIR